MPQTHPDSDPRVCVGQFAGAHGVRGQMRLRSFTAEREAAISYGPIEDETGQRRFKLRPVGQAKDMLVVVVDGVTDRDAAQALAGVKLYVPRAALPEIDDEDEYYQADLIGCAVLDPDGESLGEVKAVHDFGAGEMLEIATKGSATRLLPFTRAVVPVVDIAGRRITVDLPVEIVGEASKPDQDGAA